MRTELFEPLEARRLQAVDVSIDASARFQQIEGFGTSLAWWIPNLHEQEAWQNAFYQDLGSSMLRVDLNTLALPGIDGDIATPVTMVEDLQTNIDQFDWNSDPTTRFGAVIEAAAKKIDDFKVIASIWTPPHWMKGTEVDPRTGVPNGNVPALVPTGQYMNSVGGSLIDTPANLQQFGRYVAAYVKGYEENYGLPIYALSVQNELAFRNPFNSAVYDPALFVKAVKAVANAFDHYGITTKIMGPEALHESESLRYIDAIRADPAALAAIDIYNLHGPVGSTWWNGIKNDGKPGWMTETSGEVTTWSGGLSIGNKIQNALVHGNVNAWLYWQTSGDVDGLLLDDGESLMRGVNTTAPKYTAVKHFFRHIRPGAVRVSASPTDSTGVYASAFVQDSQKTLTGVLMNLGTTSQTINLSLSGIAVSSFNIARQSTAATPWADLGPITLSGNAASLTLPAKSILTLQGSTNALPAQTPFLGAPIAISASAATTIQAENFDKGGEGFAYHDMEKANLGGKYRTVESVDINTTTDAGGGHYVGYVKSGEWLEYAIDVASAGTFGLELRVASGGSNGKFHVEIDGVDKTGLLTVPNTAGWQNWATIGKSNVALTQGQHILRLYMNTNGSTGSVGNFNWIKVTPTGTPPPGGQTPFKGSPFAITNSAATVIQFEDFDNGGEGFAYHDVDSTNSGGKYRAGVGVDIQSTTDIGGGYNIGYVKAGEWLEYTVNVATAGSYDFDFRVASAGSNGKFHAEIDGASVTGALTVPNTGGWQNFKTLSKTGVALAQGHHVLRVFMDLAGSTGSVGNFNHVTIKPAGSPPPASSITIQAEDFDAGAEGIAYHDLDSANLGGKYRSTSVDIQSTTDAGGGYNIGYVKAGEWLNYTLALPGAGTYDFDFRVASGGSNGKLHLEVDGIDVIGQITVPSTGGWQNWTTVRKTGINLAAGTHILRLKMDANGSTGSVGNFNWLRLTST